MTLQATVLRGALGLTENKHNSPPTSAKATLQNEKGRWRKSCRSHSFTCPVLV